jgi:molecular chaperone DnaK
VIATKTQTLIQASMKLGEAMYKAQQDAAEEPAASGPGAADDVVDAEFEEVDGDQKKSA